MQGSDEGSRPREAASRSGDGDRGSSRGRASSDRVSSDRGGSEKGEGGRSRRYTQISERNRCRFCREKLTRVDYKDVLTLEKLCTSQGRIFSRKRSGNCAAHQRMVKQAIKQARFIGLLSYTD